MEKVGEERWIANPFRVSTTVRIKASRPVKTEHSISCGFGWAYKCINSPTGVFSQAVQLIFSPHLLKGSSYGLLSIHVDGFAGCNASKYQIDPRNSPDVVVGNFNIPFGSAITIVITVEFPSLVGLNPPRPPAQIQSTVPPSQSTSLTALLGDFSIGAEALDLKFWLYSGRSVRHRSVVRPKPVYASSRLLDGQWGFIDTLSSSGFAESKILNMDNNHEHQLQPDGFLYGSDSDLEDDDERDLIGTFGSMSLKPPGRVGEADKDEKKDTAGTEPFERNIRFGRVISLNDIAHQTLLALLWYFYTKNISFRPVTSLHTPATQKGPSTERFQCSPKSMYRCADRFDLKPLKNMALANIRSNLKEENIIAELASEFTSLYPEIQEIEVDFLVKNFSLRVQQDFRRLVKSIIQNNSSKMASNLLTTIVMKMQKHLNPSSTTITLPLPDSDEDEGGSKIGNWGKKGKKTQK